MKQLVTFSLLILVVAVGIVFASGIDGRWLGQIPGPEGNMDLAFTFKVQGDTITGSVETMMGEMPIKPGKVNGKQFAFDVDAGGMSVSHACTFLGDSILMRYSMMGMDTLETILKRK